MVVACNIHGYLMLLYMIPFSVDIQLGSVFNLDKYHYWFFFGGNAAESIIKVSFPLDLSISRGL